MKALLVVRFREADWTISAILQASKAAKKQVKEFRKVMGSETQPTFATSTDKAWLYWSAMTLFWLPLASVENYTDSTWNAV